MSTTPESGRELNAAAMRAMAARDFATAEQMLKRALQQSPQELPLWLNLAGSRRAQGDLRGALDAIEGALRVEPRSFHALLMKGSLLERLGQPGQAARVYRPAVDLAPPEELLDPPTLQALRHAREASERHSQELAAHLQQAVGGLRERGGSAEARRINTFIEHAAGRRKTYHQEPTHFFYPGLPAIEFHERQDFPWLTDFESTTGAIRAELLQILQQDYRDFVPYVDYPDSVPLDQWAGLNRSRRWGALHLYLYGERVEQNCVRCPGTMAAIDALPQPRVPGRSPAAMFSALQPQTRIPPHTGVANTRLVVHLPLIVPPGCGFRVGNETRPWREGEAWVFDDTIEHEAWNDSRQPRVILICDVWNPRLGAAERELVAAVMTAMDSFEGAAPGSDL